MKIATYSLIAVVAGTPVFAGGMTPAPADPVVQPSQPAPVVPVTGDWTGAYVGAELGYGDITAENDGGDADGDGVIGGLTAGYDRDFGNFVLGAGVDYDFADIDLEADGTEVGSLDSVARLKVRGGYDLGSTLIYATGGAAYADAEIGGEDYSDTGYFVGLGADYKVTDSVTVGGEVLYHQFDDFDDTGTDVEATTAQARVTYRF
ncbi:Opacity protein [Tranquillimonas rosea]|uniref:Opacity protein n=1 Tax=Tranquillimonas rosea TaxID=641238 RepID=A0A1H9TI43_9RHOB|nr:outer membrane beta-barrel protein [Tranquillimonas rosea]SER96821.1 Opacity protein [Tranquillimonas rosea]